MLFVPSDYKNEKRQASNMSSLSSHQNSSAHRGMYSTWDFLAFLVFSEVEELAAHLYCGWVGLGFAPVYPTDVQADLRPGNHLGLFIVLLKLP